jgi:hypothetical protein
MRAVKRAGVCVIAAALTLSASAGRAEAPLDRTPEALAHIQKPLDSRDLDPVRHPDRVETFALEDTFQRKPDELRGAVPVRTDLPGQFVLLPGQTPVAPELAAEIAQVLLDARSYAPWTSLCIFSPGVAIRFHQGPKAVDAYVCFHCREVAFQRVGSKRAMGKLSFDPVQERLLKLVGTARPDDRRLDEVRKQWEDEAQEGRAQAAAEERWQQAMPSSLRPFWAQMSRSILELAPMESALAAEIPEARDRILALLEWYGAGRGPWSGFPSYEEAPEKLLLGYSTIDILAAIDGRELSAPQTEGAARFFGAWTFGQERPQDLALLPAALRERLLQHSLQSADEDKRGRARHAFEVH